MTTFQRSEHTTKWIDVANLSVVWAQSQRRLDEKHAGRIAEEFDPDLFGVVTCTLPNGKGIYHVIDGQTRVAAVKKLWGDGEKVPCNVLDAKDPQAAAHIFDKINTARRGLSPIDRFKVRVTAGRETEVAVNRLITGLGYRVSNNTQDGTIRAVDRCVTTFRQFGPSVFRDTLLILTGIWGKTHDAVDGILIGGFAQFLATYGNEIDKERLVRVVSRQYTPPIRLIGAAKAAREMFRGSMATNVSRLLVETYNHNLRSGRIGHKDD